MKTFFLLSFALLFFTACSPSYDANQVSDTNEAGEYKEARGVKEKPLNPGPNINQNRL